mmetsp:Transcript_65036/g.172195  ORF Transcript_65036/g.172195 Transcript_65036/m.172195 type:complete len:206 (+) Transcript_65036:139-756(+)
MQSLCSLDCNRNETNHVESPNGAVPPVVAENREVEAVHPRSWLAREGRIQLPGSTVIRLGDAESCQDRSLRVILTRILAWHPENVQKRRSLKLTLERYFPSGLRAIVPQIVKVRVSAGLDAFMLCVWHGRRNISASVKNFVCQILHLFGEMLLSVLFVVPIEIYLLVKATHEKIFHATKDNAHARGQHFNSGCRHVTSRHPCHVH